MIKGRNCQNSYRLLPDPAGHDRNRPDPQAFGLRKRAKAARHRAVSLKCPARPMEKTSATESPNHFGEMGTDLEQGTAGLAEDRWQTKDRSSALSWFSQGMPQRRSLAK